ncbi:MAG: hypothetical protein ACR2ML_12900 [Solirubrobacteraceae bacterium]
MTIRYRRVLSGIAAVSVAGSLGLGLSACGKKKMMMDAVTTALMMPGVRVAVIPKQRADLKIVVPPCSAAKVSQGSTEIPPGSNEIIVPKGALTQTVAVQPCPPEMMMSGGMMMMPPPSSTVLLTPGGTQAQQASGGMMMMSMQNQLVIPENSSITTIILTPCATVSMMGGGGGMMMPGTDQGLAAPTSGEGKKTLVGPPCTAPPPMM